MTLLPFWLISILSIETKQTILLMLQVMKQQGRFFLYTYIIIMYLYINLLNLVIFFN